MQDHAEPDRQCAKCREVKPAQRFHRRGPRRTIVCASCRAAMRPSRAGRPDLQGDPIKAKNQTLVRRYGITLEQYDLMLEAQNYCCAICAKPHNAPRPLSVDHCHRTGRVRGLLCTRCNVALGHYEMIKEGAEEFLAKYGAGHPAISANGKD